MPLPSGILHKAYSYSSFNYLSPKTLIQGATAKGLNPKYARKLNVCVPKYEDEMRNDHVNDSEIVPSTSLLRSREDELRFR